MAALEASEGAGLIITGSLLEAAGSVVTTGSCEKNIRWKLNILVCHDVIGLTKNTCTCKMTCTVRCGHSYYVRSAYLVFAYQILNSMIHLQRSNEISYTKTNLKSECFWWYCTKVVKMKNLYQFAYHCSSVLALTTNSFT